MGVTFSIPPSPRANTSLRFSIKLTSPSALRFVSWILHAADVVGWEDYDSKST
jgi:hypothetical protein